MGLFCFGSLTIHGFHLYLINDKRVRAAAFIGTLQAGYTDFHYLRDIWKRTTEKDALIGVGMTGIGSGVVLGYDMKKAAKAVKEFCIYNCRDACRNILVLNIT